MIRNENIYIKNIYHMLTYAFKVLRESNYQQIDSEQFENIHDMFASILSKSLNILLKQGLYQEYIPHKETLATLKGKLDINNTIKQKIQHKRLLSCEYDILSVNNKFNQIIKTTTRLLIQLGNVNSEYKLALKKSMLMLSDISEVEVSNIKWNQIVFHRNNKHYKMLLNMCYFIIEGLLLTEDSGKHKMNMYIDEQKMSSLFERFVLEYYKHHHSHLKPRASQVKWDLEDKTNIKFLPKMQTDIMLSNKDFTLIIDTKFYSKTMQTHGQFNSHTFHSSNLYQILSYVKNYDLKQTGNVNGMLLYAKTNEKVTPNASFIIGGNKIDVKTLDLNTTFSSIKEQLDSFSLYLNN